MSRIPHPSELSILILRCRLSGFLVHALMGSDAASSILSFRELLSQVRMAFRLSVTTLVRGQTVTPTSLPRSSPVSLRSVRSLRRSNLRRLRLTPRLPQLDLGALGSLLSTPPWIRRQASRTSLLSLPLHVTGSLFPQKTTMALQCLPVLSQLVPTLEGMLLQGLT